MKKFIIKTFFIKNNDKLIGNMNNDDNDEQFLSKRVLRTSTCV